MDNVNLTNTLACTQLGAAINAKILTLITEDLCAAKLSIETVSGDIKVAGDNIGATRNIEKETVTAFIVRGAMINEVEAFLDSRKKRSIDDQYERN